MKPLNVLIQPRTAPGAALVNVRVASGGSGASAGQDGQVWDPAIVRRPRLSLELISPSLDGQIQTGKGDLVINLNLIRQRSDARTLYWMGAPVTIYDATDAKPSNAPSGNAPIEFTGYVRQSQLNLDNDTIALNLEVSTSHLLKPVLFSEFSGAGGTGGEAAMRGMPLPAGFGSVQNIEPVWFDTTRNIGMIDGYGNCTAINALFEGGNDFGARVNNYASYTALAAAIDAGTITPGRWGTCVAAGMVGLGAPPVKPITVDAVFGTNRTGALIRRLMEFHGGINVANVDTAAFAAIDAAVNRAVHYWTGDQREIKNLIEALAAAVNASPLVTFQGKYSITRAFGGANILTVDRQAQTAASRVTQWQALDPAIPTWRMLARSCRPGAVLTVDQILYADTIIDRGVYAAGTVYRQGNLVWSALGAQFLYINAVPTAGNGLPVLPATSTSFWSRTKPAPTGSDLLYNDGTPVESLKPAELAADITSMIIVGSDIVNLAADYTGVLKTGQLTHVNAIKLVRNGVTVTAGITWSYKVISGQINAKTNASGSTAIAGAGVTSFDAVSFQAAPAVVEIKAVYGTTTRTTLVTYNVIADPAPTGGTSGGTAGSSGSDSTINNTTATTYGAANTDILLVAAGPTGKVTLTAPLSFRFPFGTAPYQSDGTKGKWQWRVVGGTFADVATEISSTYDATVDVDGEGYKYNEAGSLSVAMTKTGLTNGVSYEFQLLLRNVTSALTRVFTGTAAAVGS